MNNALGSIGSPNFRIDVIFNSLRELQQGKFSFTFDLILSLEQ